MKPKTIVFDIDGTLCDVSSIRHLVKGGPENGYRKNFDEFHRQSVNCPTIPWVAAAARNAAGMGFRVVQVTARQDKYYPQTAWWLADNFIPSDSLRMRATGDFRPDYIVKREILDRLLTRWDVVQAYDDNPNVIKLWSEYGIPCVVVPGWEDYD